jgi:hypothetical protein
LHVVTASLPGRHFNLLYFDGCLGVARGTHHLSYWSDGRANGERTKRTPKRSSDK